MKANQVLGVCLCLGTALGVAVGAALKKEGMGLVFGVACGLLAGALFSLQRKSS